MATTVIFSCIGTCLFYVAIIYVIHELGHVIAVLSVGGRVMGLKIDWRGIGVKWRGGDSGSDHCDPRKQIIVALSGPVANLVVFAVCIAVGGLSGGGWLSLFGLCNLVFAVANLVLPGGDGMKVARIMRMVGGGVDG